MLHLCGERDYESLRGRVSRPDYLPPAVPRRRRAAYGAADVAVARAGGSVWELAAAGLPAVLVPGEFATGDHQRKNAEWFARAGGAVVVPEADARHRARGRRRRCSPTADRLAAMADAMRAAARPDAAERIADELVALAAARR